MMHIIDKLADISFQNFHSNFFFTWETAGISIELSLFPRSLFSLAIAQRCNHYPLITRNFCVLFNIINHISRSIYIYWDCPNLPMALPNYFEQSNIRYSFYGQHPNRSPIQYDSSLKERTIAVKLKHYGQNKKL